MIQSLWKNGFSVSSNLNLYSPSRNPTLRNLSKRNYNVCQRSLTHKYYTMFTFNNQNQKTQISILKWIGNKVWYIYKMQYNSALNRMITDTFNNTADSQKHDDDQKMPNTTFLGAWIPESKCWQVWFWGPGGKDVPYICDWVLTGWLLPVSSSLSFLCAGVSR